MKADLIVGKAKAKAKKLVTKSHLAKELAREREEHAQAVQRMQEATDEEVRRQKEAKRLRE